jgi:50S ribosomal protein L16 3-hydroxylase
MLYLPPGIGHHGIAEDDCITLSVGFRAPTIDDILTGFTDFLCNQSDATDHLTDPELEVQDNPGLIQPQVIDKLDHILREKLSDRRSLSLWFGQYATAPKSVETIVPPEQSASADEFISTLQAGDQLRWNEGSRFAYHEFDNETALFVDGEQYLLKGDARPFGPLLCASVNIDMTLLAKFAEDEALLGLLCVLYNQGSVYFE